VKAIARIHPARGLHVGDEYSAVTAFRNCAPHWHHYPYFTWEFLYSGPCTDGWHFSGRFHFKHADGFGSKVVGAVVQCVGTYRVETWIYRHGQLIAHAKHREIVRQDGADAASSSRSKGLN
jgi:hypothetical protein